MVIELRGNSMEKQDYKELKEMVELRHLNPAINEETGAPVLSRVRNQEGLGYVHLQTFVDALEEQGLTIDPKSLNIVEAKNEAPAPPPPPTTPPKTDDKTPPAKTPEEKPDTKETPAGATPTTPVPGPKLYTKAQLGKLSYKELQAIAKKDPDVPADKSGKELIKLLTGRPIL